MTVLIGIVTFCFIGALVDGKRPRALDRIALTVFPGLEGSTRYEERRGK